MATLYVVVLNVLSNHDFKLMFVDILAKEPAPLEKCDIELLSSLLRKHPKNLRLYERIYSPDLLQKGDHPLVCIHRRLFLKSMKKFVPILLQDLESSSATDNI